MMRDDAQAQIITRHLELHTPESYRARAFRLKMPAEFGDDPYTRYDRFYSWVINEWILEQPDAGDMMELFIGCGFNITLFCAVVTGQGAKHIHKLLGKVDNEKA